MKKVKFGILGLNPHGHTTLIKNEEKDIIIPAIKAIKKLKIKPEFILIDGNQFKTNLKIPFKCIIKGDKKYANIAAASILAKTSRDKYMFKLSIKHPEYNWIKNNGYPTKGHKNAITNYGITEHHRKSFKLS